MSASNSSLLIPTFLVVRILRRKDPSLGAAVSRIVAVKSRTRVLQMVKELFRAWLQRESLNVEARRRLGLPTSSPPCAQVLSLPRMFIVIEGTTSEIHENLAVLCTDRRFPSWIPRIFP